MGSPNKPRGALRLKPTLQLLFLDPYLRRRTWKGRQFAGLDEPMDGPLRKVREAAPPVVTPLAAGFQACGPVPYC